MYCNMEMRYVDANETKKNIKPKNGDKYVHLFTDMLVKYIQYMHLRLTRTIRFFFFFFGNRVGRHNATQIRESSPWGQAADMTTLQWGCGRPGLRAQQERQRLLKEGGGETQATG